MRHIVNGPSWKRLFGVRLIGGLLLLQGAALLAEAAGAVWLLVMRENAGLWPGIAIRFAGLAFNEWLSVIVVGALGILSVAGGVGIVFLRPWAWFMVMVLQGWTLAALLFDFFTHRQGNYASMLLAAVIVFYLNARAVREPFDLARSRSGAGVY